MCATSAAEQMTGTAGDRTRPVVGIVIPAHNEEAVIGRCIRTLLDGSSDDEFDIVVVANGCTDRTADVARGYAVAVMETGESGKAAALALGDRLLTTFPRIYLDADVELDAAGVRAMAEVLGGDDVLVAAPTVRHDTDGFSPWVRRVHRVHHAMAVEHESVAGKGAYGLNAAGHARAFPLPRVIADDCWVDRTFTPDERRIVPDAVTVVRPARTMASMIRRRVRVRMGNRELDGLGKHRQEPPFRARDVIRLVRRGSVSPIDAACYLTLVAVDRVWTRYSRASGRTVRWSTDATSRAPSGSERPTPSS